MGAPRTWSALASTCSNSTTRPPRSPVASCAPVASNSTAEIMSAAGSARALASAHPATVRVAPRRRVKQPSFAPKHRTRATPCVGVSSRQRAGAGGVSRARGQACASRQPAGRRLVPARRGDLLGQPSSGPSAHLLAPRRPACARRTPDRSASRARRRRRQHQRRQAGSRRPFARGTSTPERGWSAQRDLQLPTAAWRPDAAAMRGSRSFTRRRSEFGTTVCRLKGNTGHRRRSRRTDSAQCSYTPPSEEWAGTAREFRGVTQ